MACAFPVDLSFSLEEIRSLFKKPVWSPQDQLWMDEVSKAVASTGTHADLLATRPFHKEKMGGAGTWSR